MKNNRFWFISLICFSLIGINLDWPFFVRVIVILNSLLILGQVAFRIWEAYRPTKEEKGHA